MLFVASQVLELILYYYSLYISYYFGLANDTYSVHVDLYIALLVFFFVILLLNAVSVPMTSVFPQLYLASHISGPRVSYSFKIMLDYLCHYMLSYPIGHIPFYSFILVYLLFLDLLDIRCP